MSKGEALGAFSKHCIQKNSLTPLCFSGCLRAGGDPAAGLERPVPGHLRARRPVPPPRPRQGRRRRAQPRAGEL